MPASENRRGRPSNKERSEARKDSYTPREVHDLWKNFRGQPNEIQMLMDFAQLADKNQAIRLSQLYWKRYEQEQRTERP